MEIMRRTLAGATAKRIGHDDYRKIKTRHYSQTVPMVEVIETITGSVTIEIDVEQILADMASQALKNKSGKAVGFSGRIRAQTLTKKTDVERKPSRWAKEGGDS